MAIVIEEEKTNISIVGILTWLAVLFIIAAAVYYIFFAQPQLVEIAAPASLQNINPIAKINLNPEEVVNSPGFRLLVQYITPPAVGNVGRENPFVAP